MPLQALSAAKSTQNSHLSLANRSNQAAVSHLRLVRPINCLLKRSKLSSFVQHFEVNSIGGKCESMSLLKVCTFLAAISLAVADIVDFKPCGDVDACTIHEVRIDPCPQASEHLACHIRRRRPATMSFDFTTNFAAETLEAGLAWQKSATQDLPLITMDKQACKYTPCPTVANQRQTYTMDVPIESKFPLNPYTIKWTLKAPTGQVCCFTVDIKVVR